MEISDRKKKILCAVIEDYIASAEPVGSKKIAETAELGLSSATIRNELAELTNMGYLEQPHTSAGRIPSATGYRLYVNELMERQRLSMEETAEITRTLQGKVKQYDKLMDDVGRLASNLTNYPAMALAAPKNVTAERFDLIYVDATKFIIVIMLNDQSVHNKLVNLPFSAEQGMIQRLSAVFNTSFTRISTDEMTPEFIDSAERACGDAMGLVSVVTAFTIETLKKANEGEAVLSGASHLLQLPEFRDPDKAHEIIDFLSESEHLANLPSIPGGGDIQILIGPENVARELKDSSVVIARYDAGDGMKGIIGVIGPTRMDYSGVAAKLSCLADGLSQMLNSVAPPPGFQKLQLKGDDTHER